MVVVRPTSNQGAPLTVSVPTLTFTGPVKLLSEVRVSVEVDVSLVTPPAPEMTPERVCEAEEESSSVAPLAMEIVPA